MTKRRILKEMKKTRESFLLAVNEAKKYTGEESLEDFRVYAKLSLCYLEAYVRLRALL